MTFSIMKFYRVLQSHFNVFVCLNLNISDTIIINNLFINNTYLYIFET